MLTPRDVDEAFPAAIQSIDCYKFSSYSAQLHGARTLSHRKTLLRAGYHNLNAGSAARR
jgi:hypothetical protein